MLSPVRAYRFDRAAFHRFLAEIFLVRGFWLLENKRMTPIVVSREIRGSRLTAEIAIDALIVNVEFPFYVLWIFVYCVCHKVGFP